MAADGFTLRIYARCNKVKYGAPTSILHRSRRPDNVLFHSGTCHYIFSTSDASWVPAIPKVHNTLYTIMVGMVGFATMVGFAPKSKFHVSEYRDW